MTQDRTAHWDARYAGAEPDRLSWFEPAPDRSLAAIRASVGPGASVIDVGGGASRLPEALLAADFEDVTVLDLSAEALALSRRRLGQRAGAITWIVGDVTAWTPGRRYDLWHDRAVFHFLTDPDARRAYVRTLRAALAPGGTAIMMTFAADGPQSCSGLPVQRWSPEALAEELDRIAPGLLSPVRSETFVHLTPGGAEQRFQISLFQRRGKAD